MSLSRLRISTNFYLDEFICPELYNEWGERSLKFVDIRIVHACQLLRDITGRAVVVNNWLTGGSYRYSGVRPFDYGLGSELSQHKFGRAADVKVGYHHPQEVHRTIMEHEPEFLALGITTLEKVQYTPTWTHLDCRSSLEPHIQKVSP